MGIGNNGGGGRGLYGYFLANFPLFPQIPTFLFPFACNPLKTLRNLWEFCEKADFCNLLKYNTNLWEFSKFPFIPTYFGGNCLLCIITFPNPYSSPLLLTIFLSSWIIQSHPLFTVVIMQTKFHIMQVIYQSYPISTYLADRNTFVERKLAIMQARLSQKLKTSYPTAKPYWMQLIATKVITSSTKT